MQIDGRLIAQGTLEDLTWRVRTLQARGITPTLAIVLIGEDPASLVYVRQKEKIGQLIGGRVKRLSYPASIGVVTISKQIKSLGMDSNVHGIIVQLPLPKPLNEIPINHLIAESKDVDGFRKNSPFTPPVASAVLKILRFIYAGIKRKSFQNSRVIKPNESISGMFNWLKKKRVCVIGRGQTAGRPIASMLQRKGCQIDIIHSQTTNTEEIIRGADVVISCIGKRGVLTKNMLKKGAIVIGVGLHEEGSKLKGDYDQEEIATVSSFYTPTPGGVGPVNVACLWENCVQAAEKLSGQ